MSNDRPDIIAADSSTPAGRWPDWLQERLEWFSSLKFGLFLHWGPYSQWGCIESWPLVEADTWARPDDLAAWTVRMLGVDKPLPWRFTDAGAEITLPEQLPCEHAWVLSYPCGTT